MVDVIRCNPSIDRARDMVNDFFGEFTSDPKRLAVKLAEIAEAYRAEIVRAAAQFDTSYEDKCIKLLGEVTSLHRKISKR